MQWATRVTSVGLEFVVPPLLGVLLDRWLGSSPVCMLLGAVIGFAVGMMQILRIAKDGTQK
jgi:ATP synthase protein I